MMLFLSFKVFWGNWKMKKLLFENLFQWWDVGKANVRSFCQNYAFHTSTMVKTTVNILQKGIELLEKNPVTDNGEVYGDVLKSKKTRTEHFFKRAGKRNIDKGKILLYKRHGRSKCFLF